MQLLSVVIFEPFKHYNFEAVDITTCTGCFNFNKKKFLQAITSI